MKLYLEIIKTNNLLLLCKNKFASPAGCVIAWEKIVKRQGEITGTFNWQHYFNLESAQALLYADYITIKATLMKISLTDEDIEEDIAYLKSKRYDINPKHKIKSINAAIKRSDNLITRMKMKENEIERLKGDPSVIVEISLEDVITELNFAIGWNAADENISLAAYNKYRILLKKKNAQYDGRNNNTR